MFKRLFGGDTRTEANDVDVREARALQQRGAQLVDVREPGEFAAGHAAGAINIPLGQLTRRGGEIATDRPVLVICQSGNRSKAAQGQLSARHASAVRNVAGGTKAGRAAGLPVE